LKRFIDITKGVSTNHQTQYSEGIIPTLSDTFGCNYFASTYMFAPAPDKSTLHNIFPGRFVSDTYILTVSGLKPMDVLTCDVIGDLEENVRPGESIIIKTGWSKFFDDREIYYDKFPTIGVDLAEWLVRKKINLLSMDTPLMANCTYMPECNEIYDIFARGSMLLVNNITNLDVVDDGKYQMVAMPLKTTLGNIAPTRVILIDKF
jgi:arylformamidase